MKVKVKIGGNIYKLETNEFGVLSDLVNQGIIISEDIFELSQFSDFEMNRDKVLVYDYLNAKPELYKGLLHIKDIKFYRDNGLDNIVEYLELFNKTDQHDLCRKITKMGNLKWLIWAHETVPPCPWDEDICSRAAENGHLDCLKYAHDNGCPWDKYTCSNAAGNGHLDCLEYAYKNGCPWDKYTCYFAARNGHLECLKYAHENGCPWDKHTCYFAALNNHLDCLKYVHENGCPWDEVTCYFAAKNGHLECLKYAYENGCTCSDEIIKKYNLKK